MAERKALIADFLAANGRAEGGLSPLAGDASFRRYFRWHGARGTAVLMDAPPEHEDVRPFLFVARHLAALGLSAPEVLATDAGLGLVLLEDLGDYLYGRVLAAGGDEEALYGTAVDLLVALHRHSAPADLPPYDEARLLEEATLLTDWYMPSLAGAPTPAAVRRDYVAVWRELFPFVRAPREVLVLRDYHADNLIWLPDRDGIARVGLLDFQDAVRGHPAYDLVSLLEDARRDVAPALAEALIARYLRATGADAERFRLAYAVLGAQRNAKIIGIFTRLWKRDGKPAYLALIPRVWALLQGDLAHPALTPLAAWFERHLPPESRAASLAGAAP